MPGEAQIARLVPLLIRFFPKLIRPTFYRGSVVIANNQSPTGDAELQRALQSKTRIKKRQGFNDETAVLKVADAIKCVEEKFNSTSLLKEFTLRVVKQIFDDIMGDQQPLKSAAQDLADRMAECIREHALRQDTIRRSFRSTKYGRPAKGHGKGRRGF